MNFMPKMASVSLNEQFIVLAFTNKEIFISTKDLFHYLSLTAQNKQMNIFIVKNIIQRTVVRERIKMQK